MVFVNKQACDVDSSHPPGEEARKGRAVRPLRRYVSWVQNIVK